MRILFMGTPDFAVPSLIACCNYEVAGVFTQPDRPSGRGYKLTPPPVKSEALNRGIPVYQPDKIKSGETLELIKSLKPDLAVVVAYGRILPESILSVPPLGCVNVHASLLPKYRGAAPIQRAVLNGEAESGVTTMFMDAGLDTGDMILKRSMAVPPEMTAGELWDELSLLGANCLKDTLELIEKGSAPREAQNDANATFAPKLTKEDGLISFDMNAGEIINRVRGVTPWPGAYAEMGGEKLKILKAIPFAGSGRPGEILDSKRLIVAAADGAVELLSVQLPGKSALTGAQMMQGRRLKAGDFIR